MPPSANTPGTVYKAYAADGELLYVGCSLNAQTRIPAHKRKTWWTQVARIEIEHWDRYDDASLREQNLIATLKPSCNVQTVHCGLTLAKLQQRSREMARTCEMKRAREARRPESGGDGNDGLQEQAA